MNKIVKGECFDYTLRQKEDLDFFLISSKDNIVLNIDNNLICFKRPDLVRDFVSVNDLYVSIHINDKYIVISKKDYNLLTYRRYCVYKLNRIDILHPLYEVLAYKRDEYFELR